MLWLLGFLLRGCVATTWHAIETDPPVAGGVEAGVHFRARLVVVGGAVDRNGSSESAAGLRLVRAKAADPLTGWGVDVLCNTTSGDFVLAESLDLSSRGTLLDNSSDDKVSDEWSSASDGFATFAAPAEPFKLCFLNPAAGGGNWAPPDSDNDTLGTPVNVTAPSISFSLPTGDRREGTWAAITVTGPRLAAGRSASFSDGLKLVPPGALCVGEDAAHQARYPSARWYPSSLLDNAVAGTATAQFGSAGNLTVEGGAYTRLTARLRLPEGGDAGVRSFGVCYSSASEDRASQGAPGWRFLPPADGSLAAGDAPLRVTGPQPSSTRWAMPDRTERSFGLLRVTSTAGDLTLAPSPSPFEREAAPGGDQLRLVPASWVEPAAAGAPSSLGCFSAAPGEVALPADGLDSPSDSGPTASRFLVPDPTVHADEAEDGMRLAMDAAVGLSGQREAWALIRVPEDGEYAVCYRRAGLNWEVVGDVFVAVSAAENLTWHLNDTAAGSEAQMTVSTTSGEGTLSNEKTGFSVKLVPPAANCLSHPFLLGTDDCGNREYPDPAGPSWNADDAALRREVVAYFGLPGEAPGGYRVCGRRAAGANWRVMESVFGESVLRPTPPTDIAGGLDDSRGGAIAKLWLRSPSGVIDARPVALDGEDWGSGSAVRFAPNESLCSLAFPDSIHTVASTALTVPCDQPCTAHAENAASAFTVVRLPPPGAYKLCLKQGSRNWMAPFSFEVAGAVQFVTTGIGMLPGAVAALRLTPNVSSVVRSGVPVSVKLAFNGTMCQTTVSEQLAASWAREEGQDGVVVAIAVPPAAGRMVAPSGYDVCISDAAGWFSAGFAHLDARYGVAYAVLGQAWQGSAVRVMVHSPFPIQTNAAAAKLLPFASGQHCGRQGSFFASSSEVNGSVIAVRGPSFNTVTFLFSIPVMPAENHYRVCFYLEQRDQWVEAASDPWLSPEHAAPTPGGRLATLPHSLAVTGGTAPVGLDAETRSVLAGCFSTFRISSSSALPAGATLRLGAACEWLRGDDAVGEIGPCANCGEDADSLEQPYQYEAGIEVPVLAGDFAVCVHVRESEPRQWFSAGRVEVAASGFSASVAGDRVVVEDSSFVRETWAPRPDLAEGGDFIQAVPPGVHCRSAFSDGAPAIPLVCPHESSAPGCSSDTRVSQLRTAPIVFSGGGSFSGSRKICLLRSLPLTGRVPEGVPVAIPVDGSSAVNFFDAPDQLVWLGGVDPFAVFNSSYLMERGAVVDVAVELRSAGARAKVAGVVEVAVRSDVATAGTVVVYGMCPAAATASYSGFEVIDGVGRGSVVIMEDCHLGCEVELSVGDVLLSSAVLSEQSPVVTLSVVWRGPRDTKLAALSSDLDSQESRATTVSASGVWHPVSILLRGASGSAAAASAGSTVVKISPNPDQLSGGIFLCRYQATNASCGSVASPGPFAVSVGASGRLEIEVGTAGVAAAAALSVRFHVSGAPSIEQHLTVFVEPLRVAGVSLVSVANAFAESVPHGGVLLPVQSWQPATPLPTPLAATKAGTYLLTGKRYGLNFQVSSREGTLGYVLDNKWRLLNVTLQRNDGQGSVNQSRVKQIAVLASDAAGAWTGDFVFDEPCGVREAEKTIPCTLRFETVAAAGDAGVVSGSLSVYIRGVGQRIAVDAGASHPHTPVNSSVAVVGEGGVRDYWWTGYVAVSAAGPEAADLRSWRNGVRLDDAGKAGSNATGETGDSHIFSGLRSFLVSHGLADLAALSLSGACGGDCLVRISGAGLESEPAVPWVVVPDVSRLTGSFAEIERGSRVSAGYWYTVELYAVTAGFASTTSDDSIVTLTNITGAPGDPFLPYKSNVTTPTVAGIQSVQMKHSRASFRLKFDVPCVQCVLTFTSNGSSSWVDSPIALSWSTIPFNVHLYPKAVQLSSEVELGKADVIRRDVYQLRGEVVVLRIVAVDDEYRGDPMVAASVSLHNPRGFAVSLFTGRMVSGAVLVRIAEFDPCSSACDFSVSVESYPVLTISFISPSILPNRIFFGSAFPTASLQPFPTQPTWTTDIPTWVPHDSRFVKFDIRLFHVTADQRVIPASFPEDTRLTIHSEPVGAAEANQTLVCSGCAGPFTLAHTLRRNAAGGVFWVAGTADGRLSRVVVRVEGAPGVANETVLRWVERRDRGVRLRVMDAAAYAGDGWLVPGPVGAHCAPEDAFGDTYQGCAAGARAGRLRNWSYAAAAGGGGLFSGHAFPVWAEVHDAAGRKSVDFTGGVGLSLRDRAGTCGSPAVLEYQGWALGMERGAYQSAIRVPGKNRPSPLSEGAALLHVTITGTCVACVLEARYYPAARDPYPLAVPTALSQPVTVSILSATDFAVRLTDDGEEAPNANLTNPDTSPSTVLAVEAGGRLPVAVSLVRCIRGLCFEGTVPAGGLRLSARFSSGAASGPMLNASVAAPSRGGSFPFTAVLPQPCLACRVYATVASGPPAFLARGWLLPWLVTADAVFAGVTIRDPPPQRVRAGEVFSLSVAAVDAAGFVVADVPPAARTVRLARAEDGGAQDGGSLHWANAGSFNKSSSSLRHDSAGPPLCADVWLDGVQTWELYFTLPCHRCSISLAGVQAFVVVDAVPTRLEVQHLDLTFVLVGSPVTFRVVAVDDGGNWAESLGIDEYVPVNVSLVSVSTPDQPYQGEVLRRRPTDTNRAAPTPNAGIVAGVVQVAAAFTFPCETAFLVVDAPTAGLSNKGQLPGFSDLRPDRLPPRISVGTVGRVLAVVSGSAAAAPGGAVRLGVAAVDRSEPPRVDFNATLPVTLRQACPGVSVSGPSEVVLSAGVAEFEVSTGTQLAVNDSCDLVFTAPDGALQATRLVVPLVLVEAPCQSLVIETPFPSDVLSGKLYVSRVTCVSSGGVASSSTTGTVSVSPANASACDFPAADFQMSAGRASVLRFFPVGRCGVAFRLANLSATQGSIRSQAAEKLVIRVGGGEAAAGAAAASFSIAEDFLFEASLLDGHGEEVAGVRDVITLGATSEDGVPVALTSESSLRPVQGLPGGSWRVWLRVADFAGAPEIGFRITARVAHLSATTGRLVARKPAAGLRFGAPPLAGHTVTGRAFPLAVEALDAVGRPVFNGAAHPPRVKIRMVDPAEHSPLANQSALTSSSGGLARETSNGTASLFLTYSGPDGPVLFTALSADAEVSLTPAPVQETVFQKITRVVASAGRSIKRSGQAFEVEVKVFDQWSSLVLGDQATTVTALWTSNEYTQRVQLQPPAGVLNRGTLTFRVVYDRPSVNTTVGFRVDTLGALPVQTVWLNAFEVRSPVVSGNDDEVVVFYSPPIVVFPCGSCTYTAFNASEFASRLALYTDLPVTVSGVCDVARTLCRFLNTSSSARRATLAGVLAPGAFVEFSFDATDRLVGWDGIASLGDEVDEALANGSSPFFAEFRPFSRLAYIVHPGDAAPEPSLTATLSANDTFDVVVDPIDAAAGLVAPGWLAGLVVFFVALCQPAAVL
ncbi:hypothetical protein DIPPA_15624 [Diplonema papillatum]|nr:hypothetical protein DIPPA_15624 [Diplonema papillatum]